MSFRVKLFHTSSHGLRPSVLSLVCWRVTTFLLPFSSKEKLFRTQFFFSALSLTDNMERKWSFQVLFFFSRCCFSHSCFPRLPKLVFLTGRGSIRDFCFLARVRKMKTSLNEILMKNSPPFFSFVFFHHLLFPLIALSKNRRWKKMRRKWSENISLWPFRVPQCAIYSTCKMIGLWQSSEVKAGNIMRVILHRL